jgi:hypothetical protein
MKVMESQIITNPDGAVSDLVSRVSFYWIFKEALKGDPMSSIHVLKVKNEISLYESASILVRQDDVIKCLSSQTEMQIRRVVNNR